MEEELLYKCLEMVNQRYFQSADKDRDQVINRTILVLEKVLEQNENEIKLDKLLMKQSEVRRKKQILLDKLLDEVITDDIFCEQNKILDGKLVAMMNEEQTLRHEMNEENNLKQRLQSIREKLEMGGYEKAVTGQMLESVNKIIVHEWQIEVQFDTLLMAGIAAQSMASGKHSLLEGRYYSVFMDYPFSPNTEKGRYLDQLAIMKMLKEDPNLTAKMIAERLNRSSYMIWNRFEELKKDGCIRFNGRGGKGSWEILHEFEDTRIRITNDM